MEKTRLRPRSTGNRAGKRQGMASRRTAPFCHVVGHRAASHRHERIGGTCHRRTWNASVSHYNKRQGPGILRLQLYVYKRYMRLFNGGRKGISGRYSNSPGRYNRRGTSLFRICAHRVSNRSGTGQENFPGGCYGPVIILIGLSLAKTGMNDLGVSYDAATAAVNVNWAHILIAAFTIAVTVIFNVVEFKKNRVLNSSILFPF